MCVQNFIKLSAAVHQLSCIHTFLPYLALIKNPKIQSCDLDFWPMTLRFSGFQAVAKIHVSAKFNQAECCGSWVIVLTEKNLEQYRADSTERTTAGHTWRRWVDETGNELAINRTQDLTTITNRHRVVIIIIIIIISSSSSITVISIAVAGQV